ncbi:hypothetical protein L218DRAFT_1043628 [Marasmius fiardii PR-910]|nr:hypothetical protein L218DRAFT_1043628 [Marasmius fiardii PR-910]
MLALRFVLLAAVLSLWHGVTGLTIPYNRATSDLEARASGLTDPGEGSTHNLEARVTIKQSAAKKTTAAKKTNTSKKSATTQKNAAQTTATATKKKKKEETCPGGLNPPCVCGSKLGLRRGKLNCPDVKVTFDSATATTVSSKNGNKNSEPGLQCDHIVELQFIASKITPDMCKHFESTTGKKDLANFRAVINTPPNLVLLNDVVNNAKGQCVKSLSVEFTVERTARGLTSLMTLPVIKSNATTAANKIKEAMDTIAKNANPAFTPFSASFASDYGKLLDDVNNCAKRNVARLSKPPAPVAGQKRPRRAGQGTSATKTKASASATGGSAQNPQSKAPVKANTPAQPKTPVKPQAPAKGANTKTSAKTTKTSKKGKK